MFRLRPAQLAPKRPFLRPQHQLQRRQPPRRFGLPLRLLQLQLPVALRGSEPRFSSSKVLGINVYIKYFLT